MSKNLLFQPKFLMIFMVIIVFELMILLQFSRAEDSDGERTITGNISPVYIILFMLPLFIMAFLIVRKRNT